MSKKIYELPISKNYVHNWGLQEAIRELMQNAIDAEKDGHRMEIEYSDGMLSINTWGTNLEIQSLVLGNSGKDDVQYVGKYGEGYKLALIVLLRLGHDVEIYTNKQKWVPSFRKSRKFKIDTLHIDVYDEYDEYDDSIHICIQEIDYNQFAKLRTGNIAMLRAMNYTVGETLDCDYGEVLLDQQFKGKMFVEGLYIQEDKEFKYGYNFNSDVVDLDRDRKAINYYELRKLTALSMTSHTDVTLTERAITQRSVDVRDIVENIDDISDEFKVNFANDFMKRNDIDEDTFVGTERQIVVAGKEKNFEVENKTIAALVNYGIGNDVEYNIVNDKAKDMQGKQNAYTYYNKSDLKKLVDFVIANQSRFTQQEYENLTSWLTDRNLAPSYFYDINLDIKELMEEAFEATEANNAKD